MVVTRTADQDVAVGAARQKVVAGAAGEGVLPGAAFEEVVSAAPGVKGVVAAVAEEAVVAGAVVEGVLAVGGGFTADDDVAEAVVVFLDAGGLRIVVVGLEVAFDDGAGGRGGGGGGLGACAEVDAEVAIRPTFDFHGAAVEAGDEQGLAAVGQGSQSIGDAVFLVLPDVAELDPFGRVDDGGFAFGFDRAEFDDAQAVGIFDDVVALSGIGVIRIETHTAHQDVVAKAAVEHVVASIAFDIVIAVAAVDDVVAAASVEVVRQFVADQAVGVVRAEDDLVVGGGRPIHTVNRELQRAAVDDGGVVDEVPVAVDRPTVPVFGIGLVVSAQDSKRVVVGIFGAGVVLHLPRQHLGAVFEVLSGERALAGGGVVEVELACGVVAGVEAGVAGQRERVEVDEGVAVGQAVCGVLLRFAGNNGRIEFSQGLDCKQAFRLPIQRGLLDVVDQTI